MTEPRQFPYHVAIIMDGNGRWAAGRGMPRLVGHQAGADAVHRTVEAACELGLKALTLYAFSWENWDRPRDEIQDLMALLDEFIRREEPTLRANRVRLRAIGRLNEMPQGTMTHLRRVMDETTAFDRLTLVLALSYGGRQELVDAARHLAERVRGGGLRPDQIDEATVAHALYAPDLPDPDLIIRTSGEQRLSNFLLWQASYAEFYVTKKFWPDFGKRDLLQALTEFERRERRFGRRAPAAAGVVSNGGVR